MAREMTPQERAAAVKLYEKILSYSPDQEAVEAGDDKDFEAIRQALTETRRAALLECANKVKDRAALWRSHGGAKIGFPYGHLTVEDECDSIADELHRLAQEGS